MLLGLHDIKQTLFDLLFKATYSYVSVNYRNSSNGERTLWIAKLCFIVFVFFYFPFFFFFFFFVIRLHSCLFCLSYVFFIHPKKVPSATKNNINSEFVISSVEKQDGFKV